MKSLRVSSLAGAVAVLAAAAAAQSTPRLTASVRMEPRAATVSVAVQGPQNGVAWLLFSPGHLTVPPIPTPWGHLYLDPGRLAGVIPLRLDRAGTASVSFSIARPIAPLVLGLQAAASDGSLASLRLSNPAAMALRDGTSLTYAAGEYAATVEALSGSRVEVKALGEKGSHLTLASGTTRNGTLTLGGKVPKEVKPGEKTVRVEVYLRGKLLMWVLC